MNEKEEEVKNIVVKLVKNGFSGDDILKMCGLGKDRIDNNNKEGLQLELPNFFY